MARDFKPPGIDIVAGEAEKRKMFAAEMKLLIEETKRASFPISFNHAIPFFSSERGLTPHAIHALAGFNMRLAYTMETFGVTSIDEALWKMIRDLSEQIKPLYEKS